MWERLRKNIGWSLLSMIIVAFSGIFIVYFNTRSLGVEGLGAYATILAFGLMIEALAGMQAWQAVVALADNEQDLADTFAAALLINGGLAALGVVFGCAIAFIIKLEGGWAVYAHLSTLLIRLPDPALGVLRWHNKFGFIAVVRSTIALASMAVVTALWWIDASLEVYIISAGILYGISSIALNIEAVHSCTPKWPRKASIRRVLSFSLPAGGSGAVGTLRARGVVLLLDAFAGSAAVGLYTVADRIASVMQLFYRAAFEAIFAELSKFDRRSGIILRFSAGLFVLSIAAWISAELLGGWVVAIIAGPEFKLAAEVLVWLVIVAGVNLVTMGARAWVVLKLGPQTMLIANLISLLAMVIAPWLIIRSGAIGAATVLLLFEAIWIIAITALIMRARHR
ncbi:MAG: oligosaccharide flippase family protein [Erythrobacter sp.]|uniref:lipopolysaccharide biosynthesis protein n=1 Tax=Erythrobacter sp. TaxID=1042 RepID=UPI003266E449